MMSTPSRASCCAISSFCSEVSEKPGDCSPSRSVVSKIITRPWSSQWMQPQIASRPMLTRHSLARSQLVCYFFLMNGIMRAQLGADLLDRVLGAPSRAAP